MKQCTSEIEKKSQNGTYVHYPKAIRNKGNSLCNCNKEIENPVIKQKRFFNTEINQLFQL